MVERDTETIRMHRVLSITIVQVQYLYIAEIEVYMYSWFFPISCQ